jgi:hypothetical protein
MSPRIGSVAGDVSGVSMIRKILTLSVVLLALPIALAYELRQTMMFESEEIARVEVLLEGIDTPNITLRWAFPQSDLVGTPAPLAGTEQVKLQQEGSLTILLTPARGVFASAFSFRLRFPMFPARYAFPFPTVDLPCLNRTLDLILPMGWTGTNLSAGGEKRYDPAVGRIRLTWSNPAETPAAVLVVPGMGQERMAREVSWRFLSRNILFIILGVAAIAAVVLLLRS